MKISKIDTDNNGTLCLFDEDENVVCEINDILHPMFEWLTKYFAETDNDAIELSSKGYNHSFLITAGSLPFAWKRLSKEELMKARYDVEGWGANENK